MALLLGNASKHEFLTSEEILPETGLLKKAATIKRSTIREWVEKVDWYWKKKYQGLDKVYKFDVTISKYDKKTNTLKV